MATKRSIIFSNDHWYHIFNRGIEGRPLFLTNKDYQRFISILSFYQYSDIPLRYSYFAQLAPAFQTVMHERIKTHPKRIIASAYCLMPNHFHLLLRQHMDDGISRYVADICNSYSKYFNTKNDRIGTLFQSVFKAVHIDTEEQLLHVNRYIHINPYVSSLCRFSEVFQYSWSSLRFYIEDKQNDFVNKEFVLDNFSGKQSYRTFIEDQMSFAKKNKEMQHLLLEEE